MSLFERYLTLWVALCIVAGVALGQDVGPEGLLEEGPHDPCGPRPGGLLAAARHPGRRPG